MKDRKNAPMNIRSFFATKIAAADRRSSVDQTSAKVANPESAGEAEQSKMRRRSLAYEIERLTTRNSQLNELLRETITKSEPFPEIHSFLIAKATSLLKAHHDEIFRENYPENSGNSTLLRDNPRSSDNFNSARDNFHFHVQNTDNSRMPFQTTDNLRFVTQITDNSRLLSQNTDNSKLSYEFRDNSHLLANTNKDTFTFVNNSVNIDKNTVNFNSNSVLKHSENKREQSEVLKILVSALKRQNDELKQFKTALEIKSQLRNKNETTELDVSLEEFECSGTQPKLKTRSVATSPIPSVTTGPLLKFEDKNKPNLTNEKEDCAVILRVTNDLEDRDVTQVIATENKEDRFVTQILANENEDDDVIEISTNEVKDNICPMCRENFSSICSREEFEDHVIEHFEHMNISDFVSN